MGLLSQILISHSLFFDPSQHISIIAGIACIALCSATQIYIDAYRREILPDEELAQFFVRQCLSFVLSGTRFSGAYFADHYPWAISHLVVSVFMLVGITTSLLMPEPTNYTQREQSIIAVIFDPLKEFVQRNGIQQTILILLFMLFYKLGDSMATALATPFYLDLGFTKTDIASIVKVASLCLLSLVVSSVD